MVDIPENLEKETKPELIVLIHELVDALEEAGGPVDPGAATESAKGSKTLGIN